MPFARQWCVRRESPVGKGAREEGPGPRGSRRVGGARPEHGWPGHLRRRGHARTTARRSGVPVARPTAARRDRARRPAPAGTTKPPRRAKGKGGRYHVPTGAYFNNPRGGWDVRLRIERQVMRAINNTQKGAIIRIALYSFDRIPVAKRADRRPEARRAHPDAAQRPPGHQGDEDAARLPRDQRQARRTSSTSATRAAAPTTASGCCTRSSTRSPRPAARSGRCSSAPPT